MIFSGHIKDYQHLKHTSSDDCLLSSFSNFKSCNLLDEDHDGNYLVYDKIQSRFIRSACASVGMKNRWKSHVLSSKRRTKMEIESRFYTAYAAIDCENEPEKGERIGYFSDLVQYEGIGFMKNNKDDVNKLFDWADTELNHLSNLSIQTDDNTISDKKYKHICYLTELYGALAINPSHNISSNCGMEWQLRY